MVMIKLNSQQNQTRVMNLGKGSVRKDMVDRDGRDVRKDAWREELECIIHMYEIVKRKRTFILKSYFYSRRNTFLKF